MAIVNQMMDYLYLETYGSMSAAEPTDRLKLLRFPAHGKTRPYLYAFSDYSFADLTEHRRTKSPETFDALQWQDVGDDGGRRQREYLKKARKGWETERLPLTIFLTARQVRNKWKAEANKRAANAKTSKPQADPFEVLQDIFGKFGTRDELRDVLGVPSGATQADLKAAYRSLAALHHPDHGGDIASFKRIRAAFEGLTMEVAR